MRGEQILEVFRYYTGQDNHARYNEINQAYRNILKRTKLWNQKISKTNLVTLVSGTYQYQVDFSSFRSNTPDRAYVKNSSSQVWTELIELSQEEFERQRPSDIDGVVYTSDYNPPGYYALSGDDNYNFSLTPNPDKSYDIRFDGTAKIVELDRGVVPIIGDNYHESIAILAASIFLKQKKDATPQDLSKSQALRQEAEDELSSLYRDYNENRLPNLSWNPVTFKY